MKVYSYSEARQHLATLLNEARREGKVQTRRRDGQVYLVTPAPASGSPLEVPGVSVDLPEGELEALLKESRAASGRYLERAPARRRRNRRPQPG